MSRPKRREAPPPVHFVPHNEEGEQRTSWTACGKDSRRDDVAWSDDPPAITCKSTCRAALLAYMRQRARDREYAKREIHDQWTLAGTSDGCVKTPLANAGAVFVPQIGYLNETTARNLRRALGSALQTIAARKDR